MMNRSRPAPSQRVRFGGSHAAYRFWGGDPHEPAPGRTVLLLHGGGSGSDTWESFAARLVRAGFVAVAPDLLGHGGSPRAKSYPLEAYAEHVHAFVEQLGLAPFAVVGHSLGAYAAVDLARRRTFQRVVLEDPPAPPTSDETERPLRVPLTERLKVVLAAAVERRQFDPSAVTSAITQLRPSDDRWWRSWATMSVPTLIVSGGSASHIPVRRLERMAQRPGAELAVLDVGHRVHTLCPQGFAERVLPFLH